MEPSLSSISSSGSISPPSFVTTSSLIALFYDKQSTNVTGKYKCICKICRLMNEVNEYDWGLGQGPELITLHLKEAHCIENDNITVGMYQTQLGGYMSELPGEGSTPFIYNQERMIDALATFVSLSGLPLKFGESLHFEKLNRLCLQPAYRRVSENTLKCRIITQYYLARESLIRYFATYVGRVSLTCDTWCSEQRETYLCIGVHWVDSNFFLQRRIIAFEIMNEFHTGYDVNTRICQTLDEFNLRDKVFSISFDDVTANTKCIDHIEKNVSLLLDHVLLHVRCCSHIINLSVQEGITFLSPLLTPIRNAMKWIRLFSFGSKNYVTLCKEKGLTPRNFYLDATPPIWNSTYKMLDQALTYKDMVTVLINDSHANSETFIDDSSWRIAQQICTLLKVYYNATNVFSLVYDANVHRVIMECANIVKAMSDCEQNESCLQPIIFEMRRKWLSYFHEFPVIYGIACLLDPDLKIDGLTNMLDFYYRTLDIEYDVKKYVDHCVVVLNKLYDIYAQDGDSNVEMSKRKRFDDEFASILYGKSTNVFNTSSDIDEYFSFSYDENYSDFNIVSWWHDRSSQFPVLSKLARDILVVPASTFVSESAFSAGREVLDEERSSLMPEFVKILVCKNDWDRAEIREQGVKDDDDDEDDLFMIWDTSSEGTSSADSDDDIDD